MSDIMDRGSWFLSALFLFAVALGFYFTIDAKLHAAYSIPAFDYGAYSQFSPVNMPNAPRPALTEDEYEAEFNAAIESYKKAMAERQQMPIIGDRFFWLFSFEPSGFLRPLMGLSIFYVPFTILLATLFMGIGSFGLILRRDYGTLATCAFFAWTAAHLPAAIAGIILFNNQSLPPTVFLGIWLISGLFFGVLMIFALRTVFGADYSNAILVIALSWVSFSLSLYVFRFISPFLFSPFILFYAWMYLRGEAGTLGTAFRQKQNFRRFLNNATLNPRDADAHVQLGLIYNQRRQSSKAIEHFQKALEIDKEEIDANFAMGRIERENGNLQKALEHFSIVVEQNDKYALSEIWREIGATYQAANMLKESREALEKYVERRGFDAEGLYRFGQVLQAQGENSRAKEMFEQCVEAAKTAPSHRRAETLKWGKLAQKEVG